MLDVGDRLDDMTDLLLGKNLRKSELLSGVKCMRNHIRRRQYVFEKKATALGGHPAFIPTDHMLLFDVVDVGSNVILRKLLRMEMIVITKDIAHLGHIVADGHWGIRLGFKKRGQFE